MASDKAMPQTPREHRNAAVDALLKRIRRGMYRKQGDCDCDICDAHNALKELGTLAKEEA